MTPEQITQLFGLLAQAPTQVILSIGIYIIWKFATNALTVHLEWLHKEISAYTAQSRDIVQSVTANRVLVASKYTSLHHGNGEPTAPG